MRCLATVLIDDRVQVGRAVFRRLRVAHRREFEREPEAIEGSEHGHKPGSCRLSGLKLDDPPARNAEVTREFGLREAELDPAGTDDRAQFADRESHRLASPCWLFPTIDKVGYSTHSTM